MEASQDNHPIVKILEMFYLLYSENHNRDFHDIVNKMFKDDPNYFNYPSEMIKIEINILKEHMYMLSQKQYFLELQNEWMPITIDNQTFYYKKGTNYAYKSHNSFSPYYMYNGEKWVSINNEICVIDIDCF